MRYLIIDTWNGEGYSDSGIIKDITFDMSEGNARYKTIELARKYFADRYLTTCEHMETVVTCEPNAFCVTHRQKSGTEEIGTFNEDQGAIHFVNATDAYGLLIRPYINDVGLLSREQFIEQYEGILDSIEGDRDERLQFIDEMFDVGNAGAHTDTGFEILYKL